MLKQAANLNMLAGRQVKSTQTTKAAPKSHKLPQKNDPRQPGASFAEVAMQIAAWTAAADGSRIAAAAKSNRDQSVVESARTGCRGKPEAIAKTPGKNQQNGPTLGSAATAPIAAEAVEAPILGAGPEQAIKPALPAVNRDQQPGLTGEQQPGTTAVKKEPATPIPASKGTPETKPVGTDQAGQTEGGRYKTELNKDQTRFELENRSNLTPAANGNPNGAGETIKPADINPPPANANALSHSGLNQNHLDQLVDQMVQQIKLAPSSIEVELKPEILGKVQILVESKEGTVSISIAAQNSETASMLNANLASMRTNLEQQGINLQQMEVNLGYRENREQSSHTRDQGNQPPVRSDYPGSEPGGSEIESVIKWHRQQGLNILA